MTITETWPAAGRPFTVAELDRMPDDGRRYELLDGVLIVSPRPTTIHQFVAMRLLRVLADACPEDLCVVPEPAVELGRTQTEFDPDLAVVRIDQIGGAKFTEPPLLVVEIRSPSTALIDLNRKKAAYERFGVPSYWIVNPDPPQPELTVFELRDGSYALVATTPGPLTSPIIPSPSAIDPARPDQWTAPMTRDALRRATAWAYRLGPTAWPYARRAPAPFGPRSLVGGSSSSTGQTHLAEPIQQGGLALVPGTEFEQPLPERSRIVIVELNDAFDAGALTARLTAWRR